MTGAPIPVILDVDTGIDDAMAIMFAVRSPRIDLRAITCVAGNTNADQVVRNTLYVLDTLGAPDIPVARGAQRPLLAPLQAADHVHGRDGLGGFSRPSDRRLSPLSGVELLRAELMAAVGNGERITLVPTAPLTTIALLLRTHPEVAAGIERMVFMGGSSVRGNATAVAEFNVWHDPEAAAIALAAAGQLDIPVTMYGLDVFDQVTLTAHEAAALRRHSDPAAQLAGALLEFQCQVFGLDRATIGDAGTVCAVADPSGLTTRAWPVRVDADHGFGRGQTIVDKRDRGTDLDADPHREAQYPATVVDVAIEVAAEKYARVWQATVAG